MIQLYFHTLRHLRWQQVTNRLARPFLTRLPVKEVPIGFAKALGRWIEPIEKSNSLLGDSKFCFLGQTHQYSNDFPALRHDRDLWLYNVHYFECLMSSNCKTNKQLGTEWIQKWIDDFGVGSVPAWDPYPTSLRIVNWLKWYLGCGATTGAMLASLSRQVSILINRLEHHLLGNHLFENAKALVFASVCLTPMGGKASKAESLRLLEKCIEDQFLVDGGHFERAPGYHNVLLEGLLDLLNLARAYRYEELQKIVQPVAEKALAWSEIMAHPDGRPPFFNDTNFDIGEPYFRLAQYAEKLGLPVPTQTKASVFLDSTGYARLVSESYQVYCDDAEVGAPYIPGHAHADTLSFELSINGERLVTNTGVSTYENSATRLWERGTSAHNTIQVDGLNSSQVWKSFRVGKRAQVKGISFETNSDQTVLSAKHYGYSKLAGKISVARQWKLDAAGLEIRDRIKGPFQQLQSFLYLSPGVVVEPRAGGREVKAVMPCGTNVYLSISTGEIEIINGYWSPAFGVRLARLGIVIHSSEKENLICIRHE